MKVLIVDDDPDICELIKRELERKGIVRQVDVIHDLDEGIQKSKTEGDYDLVILDLIFRIHRMEDTVKRVAEFEPPVLLISGYDKEYIEKMVGSLTVPFLNKTNLLSDGIVGVITNALLWFQGKRRIDRLERNLAKLRQLNHQT